MQPEESPEIKFDRLKKQIQAAILRDYPNPERKGCPGGAFLRELGERPSELAVEDDPQWHHVTHCSECYREFIDFNHSFRNRARVRRVQVRWGLAFAAAMIMVAAIVGLKGSLFAVRPQNAEPAYVATTVVIPSMNRSADGEEPKPIVLERKPLKLTVELPIGSKAGVYELQLRGNDRPVLSTGGNAEIHNGTTAFTVRTNLSGFEPGSYSMAVRKVPLDWNRYPVVIQ
jgi:hypothetical protein